MKRTTRDSICRLGALAFLLLSVLYQVFFAGFAKESLEHQLIDGIVTRVFGCGIFACALLYLEYRVFEKTRKAAWIVILPGFLIAINNFPILPYFWGLVHLEEKRLLLLYAVECLMIGLFEELAFRGVLLPVLLERYGNSKKNLFWVVILSSLVFGFVHLFNLLMGAGFGGTVMQVGYSFLIGGMCAIVFLKSKNLVWSILLHAVYDFCGGVMPTLGSGEIWTTASIVWTAIFGVVVGLWFLYVLFKMDVSDNPFYKEKNHEEKES